MLGAEMKKNRIIVFWIVIQIAANLQACVAVQQIAAETPTITPTTTSTQTPIPTSTVTLTPTITPSPTRTPNLVATQQYVGFFPWVEKLYNDGLIPSVEGEYIHLDDYSDSFAKSGYYSWITYSGLVPTKFILQAQVKITNAIQSSFKSGCGFVFGEEDHPSAIFFALDGHINFFSGEHRINYLDSTLFENPDGVKITLLVIEDVMRFFVNDRMGLMSKVFYQDPIRIGPAILSGNDQDFGTRCDFSEMSLWAID
jgi:hypothetical protein